MILEEEDRRGEEEDEDGLHGHRPCMQEESTVDGSQGLAA